MSAWHVMESGHFPVATTWGFCQSNYGKNVKSDKHGSTPGLISLEPRVGSTWD